MSRSNRPPTKDMYWFAHGGPENEKLQRNSVLIDGEEELHASNSPTWNNHSERRSSPDEQRTSNNVTDSSGPSSLERDDRLRMSDKRIAVEERRKQLWEAEQERNEAVMRKHMEREAALEARRNASRSNIAFAFGSSIPRQVDTLQTNDGGDADIMSRSFTSGSTQKDEYHTSFPDQRSVSPLTFNGHAAHDKSPTQSCTYSERRVVSPPSCLFGSGALIGEDMMSRSMHASISSATRGRRKNDLMPTVPYERTPAPAKAATSSSVSHRKRSVSMTRLDQLAQPRKHYLEANKPTSSASSANSSMHKDNVRSPTRPLSSASENSGGSGRVSGSVTRRMRSSPRKPRPVSIAGTFPDQRQLSLAKPFEGKVSPVKRVQTPSKQPTTPLSAVKISTPKTTEKLKQSPRLSTPLKLSTPKPTTPKPATPKTVKQTDCKPVTAKQVSSPKTPVSKPKEKKPLPIKKKSETALSLPLAAGEGKSLSDAENLESPHSVESEVASDNEKNNAKRIISEEEAKAALAEKRRLAREQAEKEAELERQRLEQLRLEEEERLRQEEEDHRKMEEEQMRLLEEHRRHEEEKLRRAIEDQEQKEEEERARRDEEVRMKAEQEKKAKEEAEKQRLELEEKLRKEEEERAERKKRLEKIMSRTRGKSNGTSPSGSVSGSDQLDSAENAQEGFSSGANSLDSNEAADLPSEQASIEDHKAEAGDSLEANPTYEIGSENESLNSNDLMMPGSETASQENSMVIIPEKEAAVLTDVPPPSEEKDEEPQRSSEVTDIGNDEDVQEVMMTSMMTGSVYGEEMFNNANVQSEFSFGESQVQSHLENEVSMNRADLVSEFNEVQSNVDSVLPEMVENQQNLGEFNELQTPSEVPAADSFSQEMLDNFQTQFVLDSKDSANTQNFSDDLHMDAVASEMIERSSISSDLKLPDPIYETSEDGSISSEKHKMFGMQEEVNYSRNDESIAALDEVFSQQLPDPESVPHGENPFEMDAINNAKKNPFSSEYSVQRSEIDFNDLSNYDMNGAINETDHNVFNKDSSTINEAEVQQNEVAFLNKNSHFEQENNESIQPDTYSDIPVPQAENEFNDNLGFSNNATKWDADLVDSPSNIVKESSEDIGDNPFLNEQFNKDSQLDSFAVFDKDSSETSSFQTQEVSDITLIKEAGDGACIGIISSIDHDQVSNNFTNPGLLNEQFKNNFESATMTDSEDNSSLDSNLSQVMTNESNGQDHVESHSEANEPNKNGFSNGEKHNLFDLEDVYNDKHSKAGVNNFHASEMFSNSHKFESSPSAPEQMSELQGYVQVAGNGVLSVDHPKNNIFEAADAMEFGAQDPFLVKGSSSQNPFLLQDDQKQVLMAPDFLN